MDEAGSRARIRAYYARASDGAEAALAAIRELHEVQDAKAIAVKVRTALGTTINLRLLLICVSGALVGWRLP